MDCRRQQLHHAFVAPLCAFAALVACLVAPQAIQAHPGYGGVFRSLDGGHSWTETTGALPIGIVLAVAIDPADDRQIAIGTNIGLFESADRGETWQASGSTLPAGPVTALDFVSGKELLAGTPQGLFARTSPKQAFTPTGLAGEPIYTIAHRGGDILVGSRELWRAVPPGWHWQSDSRPLALTRIFAIAFSGGATYAAGDGGVFFRPSDSTVWSRAVGLPPLSALSVSASSTDASRIWVGLRREQNAIFDSRDRGSSWNLIVGVPSINGSFAVTQDPANPRHLLAATDIGLYVSDDDGAKWRWEHGGQLDQFEVGVIRFSAADPNLVIVGGAVLPYHSFLDQLSAYESPPSGNGPKSPVPALSWLILGSAFALGALHALEPGHGKTVVAAYVVGTRGRLGEAITIALSAAVTHTGSVIILGILATGATAYIIPSAIDRGLQITSGLLVVAIGAWIAIRYVRSNIHAHHDHDHGHDHNHDQNLSHGHVHPAGDNLRPSVRSLLVIGAVGGMVPCPAALAVLLTALTAGQLLFGLGTVIAFSLGLASVMVAVAFGAVVAGGWLQRRLAFVSAVTALTRPLSAGVVTVVGISMVVRALGS